MRVPGCVVCIIKQSESCASTQSDVTLSYFERVVVTIVSEGCSTVCCNSMRGRKCTACQHILWSFVQVPYMDWLTTLLRSVPEELAECIHILASVLTISAQASVRRIPNKDILTLMRKPAQNSAAVSCQCNQPGSRPRAQLEPHLLCHRQQDMLCYLTAQAMP